MNDRLATTTRRILAIAVGALLVATGCTTESTPDEIVLLTHHLEFGSTTNARIYKDRWQIELFFKALKQNLKVKTFVGTSENAVRIQIWTALIAMLVMKIQQMGSRFGWSLSHLAALLRLNAMAHRDLDAWLENPYVNLKADPPQEYLPLFANILDSRRGGHEMEPGLEGV
jgi:IS4 transposase